MTDVKTCNKCINNDKVEGVIIEENGFCNICNNHQQHIPFGENELLKIINKARKKNRIYDALVPLSGGKDSTYVLYLATFKYKLNVLAYTFDNGFMSDLAKKNIETSVKKSGVDHIWVKHDLKLIQELYRTALIHSGEICNICGLGIERSMFKISESWRIPIILLGHSPTEANSFTSEDIYDHSRLKAILNKNKNINNRMINRFLIYPKLNFITTFFLTIIGKIGKRVNILYYLDIPSDQGIGKIIKKEMDWREPDESEYTRHFDCLAEPFTNFIRDKRFGQSRRLPQLCNMIRNNEITRDEALQIVIDDNKNHLPINLEFIMSSLNLNESDINEIGKIPLNVFGNKKSIANIIFAKIRSLIKKNGR